MKTTFQCDLSPADLQEKIVCITPWFSLYNQYPDIAIKTIHETAQLILWVIDLVGNNDYSQSPSMLMVSQKVVTPVKTGVQSFSNYPKPLDSGFRRNDGKMEFLTFCEAINADIKSNVSFI